MLRNPRQGGRNILERASRDRPPSASPFSMSSRASDSTSFHVFLAVVALLVMFVSSSRLLDYRAPAERASATTSCRLATPAHSGPVLSMLRFFVLFCFLSTCLGSNYSFAARERSCCWSRAHLQCHCTGVGVRELFSTAPSSSSDLRRSTRDRVGRRSGIGRDAFGGREEMEMELLRAEGRDRF